MKGLLDPALRKVVDHHIVPVSGCRMLRYKLSQVCRSLWRLLRSERFLDFARIVSGSLAVDDCRLWWSDKGFRRECMAIIWPQSLEYEIQIISSDVSDLGHIIVQGGKRLRQRLRRIHLNVMRYVSFELKLGKLGFGWPCRSGRCCDVPARGVYNWSVKWKNYTKSFVLELAFNTLEVN